MDLKLEQFIAAHERFGKVTEALMFKDLLGWANEQDTRSSD